MKNKNLVAGILGGLVIGSALGILFAPAKGCETRKKIADKSRDLKDITKDSSEKWAQKITQTVRQLKTDSEQLLENNSKIL
ncbi:YtxH domain-containing protein [Flavobacterium glaciei]|uniref:YtxH-like protein n=1 Tax=Flavobacterium glaciei TaxID=386300 RepID=A0A562PS57_9FLAO|nr:YtxH domain-containing protein [Flavobacterium glaciei]RDI53764.1 YtxH-like protein [Flavobacterium glaciei]TWI46990.1 YtxH-like protein [Flavobacterium glaciei]